MEKEDLQYIIDSFNEIKKQNLFHQIDYSEAGTKRLLFLLNEQKQTVTAGQLSKMLNVSTARIAVLIKKLLDDGLIIVSKDDNDARKTMVEISEEGRLKNSQCVLESVKVLNQIVDQLGMDKVKEFIEISKEIKDILNNMEEGN